MRFYAQRILLTATLFASLNHASVMADSARAVDHGPIGVMGDHYHKAGEWMVSARYMRMHMSGNQSQGESLSDADVIAENNLPGRMPAKLSVVPDEMDMDMLMLGAMYAPSDRITLMAMIMAAKKDMRLNSYEPPAMMGMSGGTMGRSMPASSRGFVGSFSTSSDDIEAISISADCFACKNPRSRARISLSDCSSLLQTPTPQTPS